MKSQTKPLKSPRLRSKSREVERCGDVNRAKDKTDTNKFFDYRIIALIICATLYCTAKYFGI